MWPTLRWTWADWPHVAQNAPVRTVPQLAHAPWARSWGSRGSATGRRTAPRARGPRRAAPSSSCDAASPAVAICPQRLDLARHAALRAAPTVMLA